jgi:hypothetical protein
MYHISSHLILRDLIILIMFSIEYIIYEAPHYAVFFCNLSVMGRTLSSALFFSNALSLLSYSVTGKIVVVCILIFTLFDSSRDVRGLRRPPLRIYMTEIPK